MGEETRVETFFMTINLSFFFLLDLSAFCSEHGEREEDTYGICFHGDLKVLDRFGDCLLLDPTTCTPATVFVRIELGDRGTRS